MHIENAFYAAEDCARLNVIVRDASVKVVLFSLECGFVEKKKSKNYFINFTLDSLRK